MHINNDCIRDILFTIEDNSTYSTACCMRQATETYPKLKTYDSEAINYHLRYLEMKGFIFLPQPKFLSDYDLSPAGHEFLSNIRDNNNWAKIKDVSSTIGFASLKVVAAIAEGVATAAINQQLGFSK